MLVMVAPSGEQGPRSSMFALPVKSYPTRYLCGREFIVRESTGCDSPELLDEVYAYYSLPEAWKVAHGAEAALRDVRAAGAVKPMYANPELCTPSSKPIILLDE